MNKSDLDFPTTKEYTKKDVEKVQKRLLEMAIVITDILDKNKIKYFLTSGTLIGAVRHQGFIPWDDDFDIFLFGDEYEKALQVLRKNLPKDMIVHDKKTDPIFWPYWARVRDLNTETTAKLFPKDKHFKYQGLSLDLFRLDLIPKKDVGKTKFKEILNYQNRLYDSGLISKKEKFQTKFKFLPKYLKASFQSILSNDQTLTYWSMTDYKNGVDGKYIFPLKKYRFEGIDFWGPNDADKMLTIRYGDYMKLPAYDNRAQHYSSVHFKAQKSFK